MIVRGFFCSSPALKKNLSVQYRLFYAHNLIAMAIEIDLLNGYKIHESNVHNMWENSAGQAYKEHSRIPWTTHTKIETDSFLM